MLTIITDIIARLSHYNAIYFENYFPKFDSFNVEYLAFN